MPRRLCLIAFLVSLVGCAEDDVVPPEIARKAAEMGDPLLRAVEDNEVEAALNALHEGADPNKPAAGDLPPLHLAALHGHVEVAEALIKQRADVNRLSTRTVPGPDGELEIRTGRTPLHLAVTGNHLEFVQLLIKNRADVNVKNGHGMTPLDLATSKGQFLERMAVDEVDEERRATLTTDMDVNRSICDLLKEQGAKTSEEIEAARLDQRLKEDESGGILGQLNAELQRIREKRLRLEDEKTTPDDASKPFPKESLDKIGPFNLDNLDPPLPEGLEGTDDFRRVAPDS